MGQRHKHADVIIAWAEGAEIEHRAGPDRPWLPMTNTSSWYGYDDVEYRIKPPAKKYRVALFKDTYSGNIYTGTADNLEDANFFEKDQGFIRWLTDWIEYEE